LSVSRFQKIFLASALVIVGFVFRARSALPAAPFVSQAAPGNIGAPQVGGHVRLVPDSTISRTSAPATNMDAAIPQSPRLGSTLAPVLATNDKVDASVVPHAFDSAPISSAQISKLDFPHARLRNEAPRSIGVDPQSPAAIRRAPSENVQVADPYKVSDPQAAAPAWSAPQLLNAGYSDNALSSHTAQAASYAAPVTTISNNQVAPPPWPVPDEASESRTHIVIDGDSLERIASRYLSDPRRSREIYELNREVLSAPDLLPIGAELKIPERLASATWERRGFQPKSANPTLNRDAGRENMTRAQAATAPEAIIPRAQLAPPVMVQ
jgi:hypothetical protein